jgi:hypothetical protein
MKQGVKRIQDVKISCTYCNTEVSVTTLIVESLYFVCPGCSRTLYIHGSLLISLRSEYMAIIEHIFGSTVIGKLTNCNLKNRYPENEPVSEEYLLELRKVLDSEDPLNGVLKL